jgi:hypothetical protein
MLIYAVDFGFWILDFGLSAPEPQLASQSKIENRKSKII